MIADFNVMRVSSLFSSARSVFLFAIILRAVLLVYGHVQDQYSPLKYTDIDYYVFTDAARYMSRGRSPYARDTYRYTPLLAWLLVPTTWSGLWFDFGKVVFATSDVLAGWLILIVLRSSTDLPAYKALRFASLWLLNPMVATISTRGSSEGLLAVMVMALLWATMQKHFRLAGCLLGLAVHFKIYPFIYAASIFWWLDDSKLALSGPRTADSGRTRSFLNRARMNLAMASGLTFMALNSFMFFIYGSSFIEHTYFYHIVRTDHRHNFSPYNILLYLNSSPVGHSGKSPESFASAPQLLLSTVIIPLVLAKKDLPSAMLAQTFSFVTFNKVCTSQYFLWYMVFLPFYLPGSSFLKRPYLGITALLLWVSGQVFWLQQGFQLEFLGHSTFIPGLWASSLRFFIVNTWILGIIISDVRNTSTPSAAGKEVKRL